MSSTAPAEPLSERIRALAREILGIAEVEGWTIGDRLPEPTLAKRCAISRTPIRRALEHLAELGIAAHREEGGFALVQDPAATDLQAEHQETDPLYRTLLAERFAGLLGDQISLTRLCDRYAIARPRAQALLDALRDNGLLRRSVGHTWIFVPGLADEASYRESMDFRLILEPAALLAPGFTPARRSFTALRKRHMSVLANPDRSPPVAALVDLDTQFHDQLADCSGNRFLRAAVRQHTALRRVDEYQLHAMRSTYVATLREHLGILDAVEAGDAPLAADRLRSHLVASHDRQPSFDQAKAMAFRRLVRK